MAIPSEAGDRIAAALSDKEPRTPAVESEESGLDVDEMSVEDLAQAENSRPTLPDETADGLDDMDEAVRHAAEDRPLAEPGDIDDR